MDPAITVKVSKRYQVALPSAARRQLKIDAGDRLLVDVQDGVLLLVPEPDDHVDALLGLHREVWSGVDSTAWLEQERAAWSDSNKS